MWRTTPLHRSEVGGDLPADGAPPFPDGARTDEVQPASAGVGPLFHGTGEPPGSRRTPAPAALRAG
jgi:hypothetical protein